jgi:hydrogenase expression/formation protein HypE
MNTAMAEQRLELGKLPMGLLEALLQRYTRPDERVVVGPRIGEDAAVLDMGTRYLVVKSDPITFATDEIGWYVVHINANDVAVMGATPRWFLLTLLLPGRGASRAAVEEIFRQVDGACQALGIVLCGGHTEVTYDLKRPIAVGVMLGEVEKEDLVRTGGAQVGDDLILSKGIAIEGTAVLAREMGGKLAARLGPEIVARGRRFLTEPGISVWRDARVLCQAGRPHAMHDPTEGGLATGLWELALASEKGLIVDLEKVPVYPETRAFCQSLGLDPLGLIASGALLATVSPAESPRMLQALSAAGIPAAVIGKVVEGPAVVHAEGKPPLRVFDQDELARCFAMDGSAIHGKVVPGD